MLAFTTPENVRFRIPFAGGFQRITHVSPDAAADFFNRAHGVFDFAHLDTLHRLMVVNASPSSAEARVNFPGMDPGEEFRFYFMQHWLRMYRTVGLLVGWTILFAIVTYASNVFAITDDSTRRALIVILCGFFLIPQLIFLTKLYKYFLYLVVVTDKKIHLFKRTLVTTDRHESVDLWVLQDIDKSQRGIFQNLFGFGSLKLEAQNSQMTIHFIPHINEVHMSIVKMREQARRRTMPQEIPQKPAQTTEPPQEFQATMSAS